MEVVQRHDYALVPGAAPGARLKELTALERAAGSPVLPVERPIWPQNRSLVVRWVTLFLAPEERGAA